MTGRRQRRRPGTFAFAKCAQTPPFEEVKPGHLVACWKVSEARAETAEAGQRLTLKEQV